MISFLEHYEDDDGVLWDGIPPSLDGRRGGHRMGSSACFGGRMTGINHGLVMHGCGHGSGSGNRYVVPLVVVQLLLWMTENTNAGWLHVTTKPSPPRCPSRCWVALRFWQLLHLRSTKKRAHHNMSQTSKFIYQHWFQEHLHLSIKY